MAGALVGNLTVCGWSFWLNRRIDLSESLVSALPHFQTLQRNQIEDIDLVMGFIDKSIGWPRDWSMRFSWMREPSVAPV